MFKNLQMNAVKKLLDDWQKTLNMVINSNALSLLNFEMQNMKMAPHVALGELPKLNFNNSSDSDSDFKNSANSCYDDYIMSWRYNDCRPIYAYDVCITN